MKVLQINSVCGIRSTGRICTDIADLLIQRGHDCRIAYGRENVPPKYMDIAIHIGNEYKVKLDGVKTRLFDNAGFNSRQSTKKFLKWAREYNPDIVHLHNIHGYYINVELLFQFLRELDKPVVWTLHDCWAFTGHCTHFDGAICYKWKQGCHNCPQKKEYPASLLLDRSHKNFQKKKRLFSGINNMTIVTPSYWLAELVKQSILGEYPVEVIPNGINENIFCPTEGDFRQEYGLQDKKLVLAVASVWGKSKGYDDLIELSKRLSREYQLVIVGVNQQQKDELPSNIIGITRTNDAKQLAQIYSTADVFVNTTYQDNYPTVNLEAQACGTPVITYRTGGSPESVPDTQVIAKGDIDGLRAAIMQFEQCSLFKGDFSAQTSFMKYLDLYSKINLDTKK